MMYKYQSQSVLKNQTPIKRNNSRLTNSSKTLASQQVEQRKPSTEFESHLNQSVKNICSTSLTFIPVLFSSIKASLKLPKLKIRKPIKNKIDKTKFYNDSRDIILGSFESERRHEKSLQKNSFLTQEENKFKIRPPLELSKKSLKFFSISSSFFGKLRLFFSLLANFFKKIAELVCTSSLLAVVGLVFPLIVFVKNIFIYSYQFFAKFIKTSLSVLLLTLLSSARFFYVIIIRWMRIYGSYAAVSSRTRRFRMVAVVFMVSLMSVGVIARLYALQGVQHSKWNKIAFKQHGAGVHVEGARGHILDRNGLKLAVSVPALNLGVHPKWIKNKEEAARKLSGIIEMSPESIKEKLSIDKSFIILEKGLSISKKREIEALKIFGLELEEEFNRVYPQGDLASTIIGKAGKGGIGLSGIERSLNPSLVASSLKLSANRDARGRLLNSGVWSEDENKTVLERIKFNETSSLRRGEELRKEGSDISLTIDSMVQRIVEEEFDKSKELSKAKNVFGLMMDAESGEIVAIGQTTRYNPNENKNISTEELRNVVLQNSFEPGSTFKPIVAAVALDRGLASKDELINCENGKYPIGKRLIRDAHPIPTVSFEQVIVRSSNIGMAKLGFRLGKDQLYQSLFDFGFGQKTGIELNGESGGIMRHSKDWAQIDIATHSFGQGVSVTALQMARAYAALANGGLLVKPSIIKNQNTNEEPLRIVSEKTAEVIKRALYLVTEDEHGTGKNSRISGVPVYGKTGTAQKARENGRGYDPDKILASFIGFVDGAPIGVSKKLVFYVAVDEPGVKPRWGGTLAAPVFKSVMERTLSYMLSQLTVKQDSHYVKLDSKNKKNSIS